MGQASFPEMYERWLVGPLFRPWAEVTFEDLKLSPGHRVLDIACGTGIVARVARERLGAAGYVLGIDINADMLAVARTVAPDIDWRVGNAGALPLHDGEQFDLIVCQQGLQFFPDKSAAAAEMRRALAQGGRLAVATWRPDEEIPFFRDLRRVAERLLGPVVDLRHSFGNAAQIEVLLRDAGFHDVRSRTISRRIRFEDGAPLLRLNTMALVGMSAAGKAMADQERKHVVEDIMSGSAPVLQSYADGSGVAFELSSNLVTAKG
ncbi:methyltransferase domain-containing protein [Mesorhizobium sp. CA18]|uniref:class I SAM-dependent methyltransferase n=2 Tax=Mesorhizobium TaxID=68287 RepID=UPI001CCACD18|nr:MULTISPECIES: methyltransferase domain-containing protein [unclassified Mesorhizobium]MBZ9733135.1 methyltransferase domain-containing protein [Mesorhizobium sp. CA9]MBZ9826077.1 methyltransferase domain-containing protein [Mesorhizobium sp. CA18]MBZ9830970.1 methyltransferase domain-containing protein [Mesorhizobium sp. CA2]MBZ9835355.1 methyltransferase domain-containing protein [Mesorhizobium sp. CA3]MBZ9875961.1 methyltransferase domain-containing protein [Mesorhizobium sp. Ca11]